MNKKNLILLAFAVAALVQLGVPVQMIASREATLRAGHVFKFKTAPVDPYDAFRGRFVALNAQETAARLPDGLTVKSGQRIYVSVENGTNGFARLGLAALEPPEGTDYIAATVSHPAGAGVVIRPPFDRFYMDERDAPQAEKIYREHNLRGGAQDAWIVVRVRSGQAVVEDLVVGGQSIREALKASAGTK